MELVSENLSQNDKNLNIADNQSVESSKQMILTKRKLIIGEYN